MKDILWLHYTIIIKGKDFFRHRLVAEHFIENPHCLPEVNHIDGDISNSCVDNLEWCTKEYNELHSREYGKKEYKPFYITWGNNNHEIFDTKSQLAKKTKYNTWFGKALVT